MKIVVVGSLNIDRFTRVASLPRPGQTVAAREAFTRFGGKGANQALAAARLGASVSMIGAVGADECGRSYLRRLAGFGIRTSGIIAKDGLDTGSAAIAVEDSGENFIMVDPGANGRLTGEDITAWREEIATARVMLVQLEIPLPAVLEAIRFARAAGVAVVFNPSPWRDDIPWRELVLHSVIVNEPEARAWMGEPRYPDGLDVEQLVLTQGARPTLGFTKAGRVSVRPPSVQAVDTVGAGDAFAGAYAVAVAEGLPLAEALAFANAAGALATLSPGAQESLPDRSAVVALRRAFGPIG